MSYHVLPRLRISSDLDWLRTASAPAIPAWCPDSGARVNEMAGVRLERDIGARVPAQPRLWSALERRKKELCEATSHHPHYETPCRDIEY